MNRRTNRRTALLTRTALAAGALFAALLVACGASGNGPEGRSGSGAVVTGDPPPSAKATVVGTALDARSGAPVEGARIEAPDGSATTTDAKGRFTLSGLAAGTQGRLKASLADGRAASVQLRALRAGERLEVVLHLRRAE